MGVTFLARCNKTTGAMPTMHEYAMARLRSSNMGRVLRAVKNPKKDVMVEVRTKKRKANTAPAKKATKKPKAAPKTRKTRKAPCKYGYKGKRVAGKGGKLRCPKACSWGYRMPDGPRKGKCKLIPPSLWKRGAKLRCVNAKATGGRGYRWCDVPNKPRITYMLPAAVSPPTPPMVPVNLGPLFGAVADTPKKRTPPQTTPKKPAKRSPPTRSPNTRAKVAKMTPREKRKAARDDTKIYFGKRRQLPFGVKAKGRVLSSGSS